MWHLKEAKPQSNHKETTSLMVLHHLPCYQMLPEAICLADRPFEPKEVDSFPVMVVLSTQDGGEPFYAAHNTL